MNYPVNRYPEERRLATVLFADINGFTSLAEKLDYETTSDLIQGIWTRLDKIIEDYGGYIDKHMGDGVMAIWGVPIAGDGDAENAVTAGLALAKAMDDFAVNSLAPGASGLRLRVGINSGSVFAGYVGNRKEYTVIGDTVNVTYRFQQMADPGSVVIGEGTFRLVRGAFRVKRLTPLELKGKADPVTAFVVESVAVADGRVRYRGPDSLATYMVGRDEELERLNIIYRQAMQADHPTMALIVGEAGLGKSRLLMEFCSQLEIDVPQVSIGQARCLAQVTRVPFYLWKHLWHNWFAINAGDSPEAQRDKFTRELQRVWGKQLGGSSSIEAAQLLGYLTGIDWPGSRYLAEYTDDPTGRLNRTFEVNCELLYRAANHRPTVIWLDDLQWADRSSLDLLTYVFDNRSHSFPLLILGATRPEMLRMHPRWSNLADVIHLNPLPTTAETVSSAYPDLRSWPRQVLQELAQRSDGNPYFLEEMVKGLLKSGFDQGDPTVADLRSRMTQNLPESLRAMLQARLDDLPRETRAIALLAAVIGRVFWVGAVIAAARAASPSGTGLLSAAPSVVVERLVQDGLRQLVRAELAFPRVSSAFSQEQEYIFKHSILRDVAYSLIPNKYLPQYHLSVARWLATHPDLDYLLMAAEHFEQAGAFPEAVLHFEQAARLLYQRNNTDEAQNLIGKVQELRKRIGAPEPEHQS